MAGELDMGVPYMGGPCSWDLCAPSAGTQIACAMPALKEGADGTGPADAPHCAQARSEGVNFAPHSLQKLGIFVCWLPKPTRTCSVPRYGY